MPGFSLGIFVDPPASMRKFICGHCDNVLRFPIQAYCGHRYCRDCFDDITNRTPSLFCGLCDKEDNCQYELTKNEAFPDKGARRDLWPYPVRCLNNGCQWYGNFKKYEIHRDECVMAQRKFLTQSAGNQQCNCQIGPGVGVRRCDMCEMMIELQMITGRVQELQREVALKDATLAERDLRIQSLEMGSYDGVLMWKISHFSSKMHDAISGRLLSLYSPYFFTGRDGYKMCARIDLNGDGQGKGSHVSLFFVIMKGEYDAILKWPFSQTVTFAWMHQNNGAHMIDAFRPDPESSSFKRPTGDMNIAWGCPLFMPLKLVDDSHDFVKDDTAFIRVVVSTDDL